MVEIGYALSCEEHPPNDLVRYARRAEEAGFTFALISDHYHPWIDRQGHKRHIAAVREFADAGYDRVYIHQIGPDQEGFFQFYECEVMPKLR
jgi:alkanesulfonate monooxygenase SsuD/methylene tetrahydromethanopterin reductase-like flavin-dependent oxidoreductase (luciferase family)